MRPKGIQNLAAFSAKEVKSAVPKQREENSSSKERYESMFSAKSFLRTFWRWKEKRRFLKRNSRERMVKLEKLGGD